MRNARARILAALAFLLAFPTAAQDRTGENLFDYSTVAYHNAHGTLSSPVLASAPWVDSRTMGPDDYGILFNPDGSFLFGTVRTSTVRRGGTWSLQGSTVVLAFTTPLDAYWKTWFGTGTPTLRYLRDTSGIWRRDHLKATGGLADLYAVGSEPSAGTETWLGTVRVVTVRGTFAVGRRTQLRDAPSEKAPVRLNTVNVDGEESTLDALVPGQIIAVYARTAREERIGRVTGRWYYVWYGTEGGSFAWIFDPVLRPFPS